MRRTFLTIVITLLFLPAQAGDFLVNERRLVWQGVFETSMGIDQIEKNLIESGRFVDITITGDRITFWCQRAHLDPRDFGYSIGSVPIYVSGNDVSFFCTIQVKDGRYRATADQFVLTNNVTGGLLKEGRTERIETYSIGIDGNLKSGFLKKPAYLYDQFLTKLLTLEDKSYLDDEW